MNKCGLNRVGAIIGRTRIDRVAQVSQRILKEGQRNRPVKMETSDFGDRSFHETTVTKVEPSSDQLSIAVVVDSPSGAFSRTRLGLSSKSSLALTSLRHTTSPL